jgi:octaprenyl-diphosphate synthase
MADDVLDFSARQSDLGKSVGDDFRDGKVTLPVLIAFARGDEAEKRFWRRTLAEMDQRPGDLERAIRLVAERGGLSETLARARDYGQAALDALSGFHDGEARRALGEAALFVTERGT